MKLKLFIATGLAIIATAFLATPAFGYNGTIQRRGCTGTKVRVTGANLLEAVGYANFNDIAIALDARTVSRAPRYCAGKGTQLIQARYRYYQWNQFGLQWELMRDTGNMNRYSRYGNVSFPLDYVSSQSNPPLGLNQVESVNVLFQWRKAGRLLGWKQYYYNGSDDYVCATIQGGSCVKNYVGGYWGVKMIPGSFFL